MIGDVATLLEVAKDLGWIIHTDTIRAYLTHFLWGATEDFDILEMTRMRAAEIVRLRPFKSVQD